MNVLICDDDMYVRKMLEKIASENELVNNIFIAKDGLEAIKIAGNSKIDIALLDIDMPNLNGIEAAKIINEKLPEAKFIFITAHMEYALDSFCVHPYDNLLKPIDIDRLRKGLHKLSDKVLKQSEEDNTDKKNKLVCKEGQKIIFISMDDVLYFEKSNRAVLAHTLKESYSLNETLRELENNIVNDNFLRTHQSFIVNKTKIKGIKAIGNRSYQIEFHGTKKAASLSRHKYKKLIKGLSNNI